MQFYDLTSMLQAVVSPVILISGAGLLILSMTNRFARVLDRSHGLVEAQRHATQEERERLAPQVAILIRRARLLRSVIGFATLSVLIAVILVISLFFTAVLHVEAVMVSVILFIACLLSLIISLLIFLQDINLSLAALKLELDQTMRQIPDPRRILSGVSRPEYHQKHCPAYAAAGDQPVP